MPTSGEGMFHKKPSMTESWERDTKSEFYSEIQKSDYRIRCRQSAKAGGDTAFSTCRISLLEDEGTIQYFLENHPEFELVKGNKITAAQGKG